jgi:SAM-dependent methyltransferase
MGQCRVCKSELLALYIHYPNAPASIERLLSVDELESDVSIDLRILRCETCGFVQQEHSPLPADYYRNYDKSAVHSPKMLGYQIGLAEELVGRFELAGKSVLEAGCGDGHFAAALEALGAKVVGVDPGGPAVQTARKRGIQVIEDFLHPDLPLEPHSFDAFISRQVISHVEDLSRFFAGVHAFLKPGGFGFIEVPDVTLAIRESRYFDFFSDYTNYFTPDTAWRLLEENNFTPIELSSRMGGEYFLAVFSPTEADSRALDFEKPVNQLRNIIQAELQSGRKVACWGAGGRGVSLLALTELGPQEIDYVVDVSPDKQGEYLPGSHLPVVGPDYLEKNSVDTIVITALMFEEEILKDLHDRRKFEGRIVLLLPEPHIKMADQ